MLIIFFSFRFAIYRKLQYHYSIFFKDLRYIPHDISHFWLKYSYNDQKGAEAVNTKEAVAKRILELCNERNIAVNALANISGVAPSTIYSMINTKSQNPGVVSIKKLCDGLDISIREFFESPIFDNIEQEIK